MIQIHKKSTKIHLTSPFKTLAHRTYSEVVSAAEVGRGATNNPKTPKSKQKIATAPAKKKGKAKFGLQNIKRSVKKKSGKMSVVRSGEQDDGPDSTPEPTAANLPVEIPTSQDHFSKLFLANSPDRTNPSADPGAIFIADNVERPDVTAAASRQFSIYWFWQFFSCFFSLSRISSKVLMNWRSYKLRHTS